MADETDFHFQKAELAAYNYQTERHGTKGLSMFLFALGRLAFPALNLGGDSVLI